MFAEGGEGGAAFVEADGQAVAAGLAGGQVLPGGRVVVEGRAHQRAGEGLDAREVCARPGRSGASW